MLISVLLFDMVVDVWVRYSEHQRYWTSELPDVLHTSEVILRVVLLLYTSTNTIQNKSTSLYSINNLQYFVYSYLLTQVPKINHALSIYLYPTISTACSNNKQSLLSS